MEMQIDFLRKERFTKRFLSMETLRDWSRISQELNHGFLKLVDTVPYCKLNASTPAPVDPIEYSVG